MDDRLILIASLALLVFWVIGAYNRLVRLRGAVAAQWTAVDAALRRRHTLARDGLGLAGSSLPGTAWPAEETALLNTLAAAARQADTAVQAVAQRPLEAGPMQSLGLAEQVLERTLGSLRQRAEAQAATAAADPAPGPQPSVDPAGRLLLQALVQTLQQAGQQIAFSRGPHDAAVSAYNLAREEWPTRLVADLFNFRPAARLPSLVAEAAELPLSLSDRPDPVPNDVR